MQEFIARGAEGASKYEGNARFSYERQQPWILNSSTAPAPSIHPRWELTGLICRDFCFPGEEHTAPMRLAARL